MGEATAVVDSLHAAHFRMRFGARGAPLALLNTKATQARHIQLTTSDISEILN